MANYTATVAWVCPNCQWGAPYRLPQGHPPDFRRRVASFFLSTELRRLRFRRG